MCVRERRDEDGLEVEDVVMIPERERAGFQLRCTSQVKKREEGKGKCYIM